MPEDQVYFGSLENGQSSNTHDIAWLKQVFNPQTKDIAGNRRRLLLVDRHSSHVNLEFINYCDQNQILFLILPPHTTHRLQPLDIELFQPFVGWTSYHSFGRTDGFHVFSAFLRYLGSDSIGVSYCYLDGRSLYICR